MGLLPIKEIDVPNSARVLAPTDRAQMTHRANSHERRIAAGAVGSCDRSLVARHGPCNGTGSWSSVAASALSNKTGRLEWQTLLLVAGILAVALVTSVAVAAIRSVGVADRQRTQFLAVRGAARDVMVHALEAENGARAYLLAGDVERLAPYHAGIAGIEPAFARLDQERRGRHEQAVMELRGLMTAVRTDLATAVALHQAGRTAEAVSQIAPSHDQMAREREIVAAIHTTETYSAEAARTRQGRLRKFASTVIIVGCTVTALALIVGLLAQRRRNRERVHAFEIVSRQVRELEEQRREMTRGVIALASANDALATTNDALSRSNRDLDQFAYVASHDLKAPLRGISSLATWIEDDLAGKITDEVREHLRLMRNRVDRMESLIDGILAYARAGKRRGQVCSVNVRQLVADTKDLLEAPVAIRIAAADGPWPTLQTEPAPMQQVWLNLLSNAIKHGVPGGGTIEVGCGVIDGELRYWVKDDGCGIAPTYHDRVFEIFQRLASRDEVEGAGIGLSVVRKLVEAQGGRVWIESAVGEGTTMFFTWGTNNAATSTGPMVSPTTTKPTPIPSRAATATATTTPATALARSVRP